MTEFDVFLSHNSKDTPPCGNWRKPFGSGVCRFGWTRIIWCRVGPGRKPWKRSKQALRWLEDPKVEALPKNQVRWRLDLTPDGGSFNVATAACKHYYAKLALASSRILLREDATLPPAGECADEGKIRQAVAEDVRRYALVQPAQEQAGQALMARLSGR